MKKLFAILLIFISGLAIGQKPGQKIKKTTSGSYKEHIVAPKESFYSIGRLYHLTPKEIASFNNLDLEKGLSIGQILKIPVEGKKSIAEEKPAKNEQSTPRNHTVQKGETLYQIAKKYKLTVAELKKLNNLTNDNIEPGKLLVVGYSKSENKTSTDIKAGQTVKQEPVENKPNTITEIPAKEKEKPAEQLTETKKVVTENTPKEAPVKSKETNVGYGNSNPPTSTQKKPEPVDLSFPNGEIPAEGAFSVLYAPTKEKMGDNTPTYFNKVGETATFKSTSGWQDKKYYALINDVEPGTILKITSLENKVIYAKVLGNMPEMKENKGLLMRLSNSAASALGIIDSKFTVQVSFYAAVE